MHQLRGLLVAMIVAASSVGSTSAQTTLVEEAEKTPPEAATTTLPGSASGPVTPEMWLYMQAVQRYQQPKEAVRRKAELRATQRQRRIEAQRWFGFSKLRPIANPIPFYGSYSPAWVGSPSRPFDWVGYGQPFVTYHTTIRAE